VDTESTVHIVVWRVEWEHCKGCVKFEFNDIIPLYTKNDSARQPILVGKYIIFVILVSLKYLI